MLPPRTFRRMTGCLFQTALFWAVCAPGVHAATTEAAFQVRIEAARTAVEAGGLDQPQRQGALAQLDLARADDREADNVLRRISELRAEAAALPSRMERVREALELDREQTLKEWAARLPPNADAETLERVLEQERAIIAELGEQANAVAGDLALTVSRPAQAAGEIVTLRRRIEQLSTPPVAPEGENPVLTEVRRVRRDSELRRAQAELERRLLEQDTATNRQRLYELTLRELRYRQGLHTQRVEVLQARIAELGQRELETLVTQLTEREAMLAATPGPAAGAASENRALGDELVVQTARLSRDRLNLAAVEQTRDRVAASLRDSRTRIEIAGTSQAVGRWLWSERRRLESPARLRQRVDVVRSNLAELRLRMVMLNEQQRDLVDVGAAARAMSAVDAQEADGNVAEVPVEASLEPLLRERVRLLALLEPLLQRRIATVEQSERALQAQLDDTVALQQLLTRHLLWTPSHPPIDGSWLQRVPEGLYDLVKPDRFLKTLELSWRTIRSQPWPWLGSLLVLLALVELRRRAPARIEAHAAVTRQVRRDTFNATARTLGWTLLAALPAPVALWLLGELLQSVGNPGRYSHSLGRATGMLVVPLLAVQVLRWTAIERGLGHAHFRWLAARREAVRRIVPVAAVVVLPMYFVSSLAFIRNLDLPNDVQARMAIVVASGAMAWFLWKLLDAGRIWVVRGVETEPSTLRRILRLILPAFALWIAGLALAGYVYSANYLLQALMATFALAVAVAIVVGLLARWFLLGERRLAFNRRLERRAAVEAAAEERGEPTPEAEPEVTLEQVNAQTGRLLRALRLTLVAAGLIWVWSDVLPAFARLDEVALWHFTQPGADGAATLQPVTLMAALFGAFALALTAVSARNLPGLIEIGLLSHTRIDAASRYAVTSILRYAIVITGSLVGLGLLGMRWSQLQWMAAALTVGLGFGLQEIFANFVSGLILLFERPFRVGDVITVGELSGRVTRIRTRATTILDFDNKEIVVPNKNFITGQLINWTLSDTTTRVIIKVGVAYGTNPRRVEELLLKAARENGHVLAEPEPKCWFLTFGASSLDFELRVFVSTLGDRLEVQHDLNTRITQLFAENGIEIAFPQLDLHVRDLPPGLGNQSRS
jgi:potassium-dependent mechanosensitive channel